MAWSTCPSSQRGELVTLLGKAFRQMVEKGAPMPTQAELERAKEAVIEGVRR